MEHCEHYYRSGGAGKPTDTHSCADATPSNGQSAKPKLLAAVATPIDDIADCLDPEASTDNSVTFAITGNNNDIDAYYVGVD